MDMISFAISENDLVDKYIRENYGEVPRIRGVRFMKIEDRSDTKPNIDVLDMFPTNEYDLDYTQVNEMFNKYVGQDVIYIHTRCGDCGMGYDDEDSNYVYCGAKDWEDKYKDLFLEHITEPFDNTYCTHYFKAVVNDDYKKIIEGEKE